MLVTNLRIEELFRPGSLKSLNELISRLRTLGSRVDLLVFMILQALPNKYSQLKVSYNTQDKSWDVDELIAQCVQEETRQRQEKGKDTKTVNFVQGGKGRKFNNAGKSSTLNLLIRLVLLLKYLKLLKDLTILNQRLKMLLNLNVFSAKLEVI
ncbi:hypothetical protein DVH24_031277 [Malus domestica]|uniref:Uncharacterized protein n=1 Tax=Malus domestica TaxID=3750 RepID=A0A498HF51_MALDO|nr:hypothetical protein DVH24_031277 [Malus domestica]